MNDKQKLAAMGEHMSEQAAQPMCMAKRIEELEAQARVMAELLRDARKYVTALGKPDDEVSAVQMTVSRIDALLAGQVREPAVPDALVALSDIASLQRYTLGGHCDSFGQDCGAEMEPDDEGEYILLSEALMLAAAPSPDGAK